MNALYEGHDPGRGSGRSREVGGINARPDDKADQEVLSKTVSDTSCHAIGGGFAGLTQTNSFKKTRPRLAVGAT